MFSLAEMLAAQARELFGYTGKVTRSASDEMDYLTDNPLRRCPVIAKARAAIGFEPEVPLEEGLRRTLLWYRGHQQANEDP